MTKNVFPSWNFHITWEIIDIVFEYSYQNVKVSIYIGVNWVLIVSVPTFVRCFDFCQSTVSRLIAFARACDTYQDFLFHHKNLVARLISQGFIASRLKSKFVVFFNRYNKLVTKYEKTSSSHILDVYGS